MLVRTGGSANVLKSWCLLSPRSGYRWCARRSCESQVPCQERGLEQPAAPGVVVDSVTVKIDLSGRSGPWCPCCLLGPSRSLLVGLPWCSPAPTQKLIAPDLDVELPRLSASRSSAHAMKPTGAPYSSTHRLAPGMEHRQKTMHRRHLSP